MHCSDTRSSNDVVVDMEDCVELESRPAGAADVRFPLSHRAPARTRRHEHIGPEGTKAPESPEHKRTRRPEPSSPTATYRSDVEVDQNMDLFIEMDRHILASVLLDVDVTEVFSPIRVNELVAKFGLVFGSSLDLTNG